MIKNWQHLCIFGRIAFTGIDIDRQIVYHDGHQILIRVYKYEVDYIDNETGEILLVQGEDGEPTYLSDWANEEPTEGYQLA